MTNATLKVLAALATAVMIFTSTVPGQTTPLPCQEATFQAPVIRDITLGMPIADLLKALPNIEVPKASELGYSEFRLTFYPPLQQYSSYGSAEDPNAIDIRKFPKYAGLARLRIKLLDDRVAFAEFQYNSETKWRNSREFIEAFAKATNLPNRFAALGPSGALGMTCHAVDFFAGIVTDRPYVKMVDSTADAVIRQRQQEAEKKKKETFRP